MIDEIQVLNTTPVDDVSKLIAESLLTIDRVLRLPLEGIGWAGDGNRVELLGSLGAYFDSPAVKHALYTHLPGMLHDQPRRIPAQALGLGGERALILLPCATLENYGAGSTTAGLLLATPPDVPLSEEQWQAITATARLTAIALYGLHTLRESRKQQVRLQATARVGRDATILLDPTELLNRVAQLISEQFNFYHVGIFLVDDAGEYAVLWATNSEHGRKLLKRQHRLKIGEQGMVGYVTGTGKARIALDVDRDATHLVNPFLPDTRSEITLPMRYGGQVIGAIDVQSTEENAFTSDDLITLQIMADQLANALINARLHDEVWQRLDETRLLREVMMHATGMNRGEVFRKVLDLLKSQLHFTYQAFFESENGRLVSHANSNWPQMQVTLVGTPWERIWEGQLFWHTTYKKDRDLSWAGDDIHSMAAIPIQESGRTVAIFAIANPVTKQIEARDLHFLEALASQLGTLLQSVHYYETTIRGVALLRHLHQTSEQMIAAQDVTKILDIFADTLLAEIRGAVEVGLLGEDEHITWAKRQTVPGLEHVLCAHRLSREYADLLTRNLTEHHIIMPEQRAALQTHYPQLEEFFRDLPAYALLLQPLQTKERSVGLLLFTLDIADETPLLERIAWIKTLANQCALTLDNAQLLGRLQAQTKELRRAYDEARRLNEIRTQMIQNVSHELRTPLNLIMGYTQMMELEAAGTLNEQQKHILGIIYNRSQDLNRMVQSLTSMQGKIELESLTPVALGQVISQVIQEFQSFAQRQGVQFYVEVSSAMPPVPGDADRLYLALTHLIENAIKFSPEGGNVVVRAWVEPEWAVLTITDQGIGIAPEHLKHIFERFYQVDGSTTRRFGGMGIGLAIVWDIVEAHGGSIQVSSVEGQGSTFTVFLPYNLTKHIVK